MFWSGSSRSCSTALPAKTTASVTKNPGRLVLLGHPVAHSLSPIFQNAALRAAGMSLLYEAVDVAPRELLPLLRKFKALGVAGNVTIPHKVKVHASCDELTTIAERVG